MADPIEEAGEVAAEYAARRRMAEACWKEAQKFMSAARQLSETARQLTDAGDAAAARTDYELARNSFTQMWRELKETIELAGYND